MPRQGRNSSTRFFSPGHGGHCRPHSDFKASLCRSRKRNLRSSATFMQRTRLRIDLPIVIKRIKLVAVGSVMVQSYDTRLWRISDPVSYAKEARLLSDLVPMLLILALAFDRNYSAVASLPVASALSDLFRPFPAPLQSTSFPRLPPVPVSFRRLRVVRDTMPGSRTASIEHCSRRSKKRGK